MPKRPPLWLTWAREIQALAQTGLHYSHDAFERQRAERLLEIAAEIVEHHAEMPFDEVRLAFDAQPGYVTPKVDVRGAVIRNQEILMVREAIDGGWTLPGGWAEVGESPRAAVEREVQEESGLWVRAVRLVGLYDANRVEEAMTLFHAYKAVFLCELVSGELAASSETSQVGFFPLRQIPQPFSGHRTAQRHIEDSVACLRDPALPAVFD